VLEHNDLMSVGIRNWVTGGRKQIILLNDRNQTPANLSKFHEISSHFVARFLRNNLAKNVSARLQNQGIK
jgi:hypothetical protein